MEWRRNDYKYYNTDLIQAYRLYTLGFCGCGRIKCNEQITGNIGSFASG